MTTRPTTPASSPILTPDQLAERWGTSTDVVWDAVDDETNPIPWIYLGRGKPAKGRRGQRGLYRFRLADVEAWEEARLRSFRPALETEAPVKVAPGTIPGWDGVDRLGGRRRRKGAGA